MTFNASAPEQWPRFVSLVQQNAPQMPQTRRTQLQEDQETASRALGVFTAMLGALNIPVPDVASAVLDGAAAGTADSAVGVANNIADAAAGQLVSSFAGGGAGLIVGNGIAVLRGAIAALERSDEMVTYLMGITGYTATLTRLALKAARDQTPYLSMPQPVVPSYIEQRGDMYSTWRRAAFQRGYEAAGRVRSELDALRPAGGGDHYSKRVFLHLYLMGNPNLTIPQDMTWRLREGIEEAVLRTLLARDLSRQREELRRWAMRG